MEKKNSMWHPIAGASPSQTFKLNHKRGFKDLGFAAIRLLNLLRTISWGRSAPQKSRRIFCSPSFNILPAQWPYPTLGDQFACGHNDSVQNKSLRKAGL